MLLFHHQHIYRREREEGKGEGGKRRHLLASVQTLPLQ
jgi:hypothetical protein